MRMFLLLLLITSFSFSQSWAAEQTPNTLEETIDLEDNEFSTNDFSLGFNVGRRAFTGGAGQLLNDGLMFGATALYDINNSIAAEIGYSYSGHDINSSILSTTGRVDFSSITIKGRYYPQISSLPYNILPYLSAGLSNNTLIMNITNSANTSKKDYIGYQAGLGSKFLFASDRAFFDIQLAYKQLDFGGAEILDQNLNSTGVRFEGNEISLISAVTFIL